MVRCALDYRDICRRRALLPLFNVKGHAVALFERAETGCIDRRMMYEDIRAVFLLDKAIALLVIKPFDNAIRHGDTPLLKRFIVSYFRLPLDQMAKNDLKEPARRLQN